MSLRVVGVVSQVSSSCMDFMQKLLEPDQLHRGSRMTIEEAMRHKWLQGYMYR